MGETEGALCRVVRADLDARRWNMRSRAEDVFDAIFHAVTIGVVMNACLPADAGKSANPMGIGARAKVE